MLIITRSNMALRIVGLIDQLLFTNAAQLFKETKTECSETEVPSLAECKTANDLKTERT